MDIDIIVFDGFDELDAIAPFEVLRNAEAQGADLHATLVGLHGAGEITAAHGSRLIVERGVSERADMVIVPGGGWNSRAPQGARAEAERGDLPALLRREHARGATIAAVCTGGMVLAAAGITRGRRATTHHLALDELRRSGADVVEARVVDDGDVLTAGGVTLGHRPRAVDRRARSPARTSPTPWRRRSSTSARWRCCGRRLPRMSTAIVTGASAGIGTVFARRLAERGSDLVLVARRQERIEGLAEELAAAHGVRAEPLVADLGDPAGVARVAERAAADDVGTLVNNAGINGYAPFAEVDPDIVAKVIAVNVTALALLSRAALPGMLERGEGTIVNVASILAFAASLPPDPLPLRATYAATKGFVLTFTRTLAAEVADTPVRVQVRVPRLHEDGVPHDERRRPGRRDGARRPARGRDAPRARRAGLPRRPRRGRGRLRARPRRRRRRWTGSSRPSRACAAGTSRRWPTATARA